MAHIIRPDLVKILTEVAGTARDGASAVEIACVSGVPTTDPAAVYNFVRRFVHEDWIDGESLVQAGKTPEESGFNDRFHNIERDLDALGDNVKRAFDAIALLRAQLRVCLNEIVVALNQGTKDTAKDSKDGKDTPDAKNQKDTKETKDSKDNPDHKHDKDTKDNKEDKENKDDTDKDPKEDLKDHLGAAEKKDDDHGHYIPAPAIDGTPGTAHVGTTQLPTTGVRVFIHPGERPALGERALNEPRSE